MSDTIVQSTLFGATLTDGDSLGGTWTTTYNASGQIIAIDATFEVFSATSPADDTIFTLTSVNDGQGSGVNGLANPTGSGVYELIMTTGSGGVYSDLYVDWSGELPTQLSITSPGNPFPPGYFFTSVSIGGTIIGLATAGVVTSNLVCFATGTRIATPAGPIAVEDLSVGQEIVSAAGEAKPIRWIGRRSIDLSRHAEPELVRPIRIAAGALADNVPVRDLVVSPDHAMLVDGALIPARMLVNHRSITQDAAATRVTYFHIELDRHDVILAEGAPTESYFDTGNRDFFANAAVTMLSPVIQLPRTPASGACMALTTDAGTVQPIWQRLADRAGGVAAQAANDAAPDAGVTLLAGSRTLRPVVAQDGRLIFALPRGTREVRLVSAAARPSSARPWLDDRRKLGVAVGAVSADHAAVPLDGPAFGAGWWNLESDGVSAYRWSNGDAVLTLPEGSSMLTVRVRAMMASDSALVRAA